MAESRRIQFTTLCCEVQGVGQLPAALTSEESDLQAAPDNGSVRMTVTLFEPDELSFPEVNYSELIEDRISHTVEIPLSRFEQDENGVNEDRKIIARLESKYVSIHANGGNPNKKKDRIQDLLDIGYGYDDEDSFIDNSEAYDEFVPASITTRFGGFYVNSGLLQFRQTSDTEDITTEEETLEPLKKRKLNDGQQKPRKKPSRKDTEIGSKEDPKSRALTDIGPDELKKKKKKPVATLSITSMLKKFQREKEKKQSREVYQSPAVIMGTSTIPLCPADAAGGGGMGFTDPLLNLIGSTNDQTLIQVANTEDFDIDLDSLLEATEGTLSPKLAPQSVTEMQLFQPRMADIQASHPNAKIDLQMKPHLEQISSTSPIQHVSLPHGLSLDLANSIQKLAMAAKMTEGESKLKFFTPEINSILLDVELQCREQGGQVRSKVFTHLSSFLPCSRDTLLKRAKKLLNTHMEEPNDTEDPMHKLKLAIGKAMPEQIAHFYDNCQVYKQGKSSKALKDEKEGKQSTSPEDDVDEKGGRRGGPKKLFEWNEEIRECLCHVLRVKLERFNREQKGSREQEEYLKTVLDSEIKPLWPKGWMQSRVLIRESKSILSISTSLPAKRARLEKKEQPSISGVPTPSNSGNALQRSTPIQRGHEADNPSIEDSTVVLLGAEQAAAIRKMEGTATSAAPTHLLHDIPVSTMPSLG